jgi:hypothetical protein
LGAALRANLEHYKQLEAQARDAERRLAALDAICGQGERIAQERRHVPGQPPPTRDLHEANLGIHRVTIEKYEPLVRALFEAVRNVDRKPGGKLPAREPLVTGGATSVHLPHNLRPAAPG